MINYIKVKYLSKITLKIYEEVAEIKGVVKNLNHFADLATSEIANSTPYSVIIDYEFYYNSELVYKNSNHDWRLTNMSPVDRRNTLAIFGDAIYKLSVDNKKSWLFNLELVPHLKDYLSKYNFDVDAVKFVDVRELDNYFGWLYDYVKVRGYTDKILQSISKRGYCDVSIFDYSCKLQPLHFQLCFEKDKCSIELCNSRYSLQYKDLAKTYFDFVKYIFDSFKIKAWVF